MITERIQQLVALAMKDSVLTYRERVTITQEAARDGISEQEIAQYLNEAISSALNNAPKENLKRCPKCGGQIPLISNQCLYCGHEFGDADSGAGDAVKGSDAASIIEQENANTAKAQSEITHCPDCGSLLPLLGNICTHCGHVVHEQRDSQFNIGNLVGDINSSIKELRSYNVTKEEVSADMKPVVIFGGLVILMIVLSYVHENLFQYSISAAIIYALIYLRQIWTAKDKNLDAADRRFFNNLFLYERYSSHVETLYGNDPEGKKALEDFQKAIQESQDRRNKVISDTRRRNMIILGAFISVILLLGAFHSKLDFQYDLEQNLRNYNPSQDGGSDFDRAFIGHNVNMRNLINRTVALKYGKQNGDGSLDSNFIVPANMFDFIKPVPDATLSVSFHNEEGKDALTADTYSISLRLDNVFIESSGKAWTGENDTLVAYARLCGKGADYLGKNIMICTNWSIYPKLYNIPTDKALWHVSMLKEGRGGEYVIFVNNYQLEYSSLGEVMDFMDNVDSYYLEFRKLDEVRKEAENGD